MCLLMKRKPVYQMHPTTSDAASCGALHRGVRGIAKLALAGATLALAALAVQPTCAEAYSGTQGSGSIAYVSCEGSNPRGYYCNSVEDVIDCVDDMISTTHNPYHVDEVAIDLLKDWNTKSYGQLSFDDGYTYHLNLHGYMINRDLTTADTEFYGTGDGDVIRIEDEKTHLLIDGGTTEELEREHVGKLIDDGKGGKFWKYDANANKNDDSTYVIKGGLITGGADDDYECGGGISVEEDAYLYATSVTLAGNVTDTWGGQNRNGGAIHNMGTTHLQSCKVIYNHSEGHAGGIYCGVGSASYTALTDTEVSYNTALDNGGGIGSDSLTATLSIRGHSKVSHNICVKHGGGIYFNTYDNCTFDLGENTEVSYNTAKRGGGICLEQAATEAPNTTITFNDGVTISHNTSSGVGGGVLFSVPILSENIFKANGTWTVSENTASSGGGIAQYNSVQGQSQAGGNVDQNINFGDLVLTNNEAKSGNGGGIFKYGAGTTKFGSGAVLQNNKAASDGGCLYNFCRAGYGDGTFYCFPDGGLTISGNSSAANGGAIAISTSRNETTLKCSTGGMKFENNTAGKSGGAIYVSQFEDGRPASSYYSGGKLEIFGDKTTEFTNNTAGNRGGAIMLSCETDRTTHISNATFTSNAAGKGGTEGYGGAIFFMNELYLKNVDITDNSATKGGGGIYCGNDEYSNFQFAGKMTVSANNKVSYAADGSVSASTANNLEMKGEQQVLGASGQDAVTADSKVGVTISDYSSGKRRITANTAYVTGNLNSAWKSAVLSDDLRYEVVREGDHLYLSTATTENELQVYGADETTPVSPINKYKSGTEVELKTSDYPKTTTSGGQTYTWKLDYWTVSCETSGTVKTVTPDANGVATITMDSDTTVARAHYTAPLTQLFLGVTDRDGWDALTTVQGGVAAYAHSAQFDDAEGIRSTFAFTADDSPFTIVTRQVNENKDSDGYVESKDVTYTITMPTSVATEKGLVVDRDALKSFNLQTIFSSMNVSATSSGGHLSVNSDGTSVTFVGTVTVANSAKKICTVNFDTNGGAFSNGDTTETRNVESGSTLGDMLLENPTMEGKKFAGWFIKGKDVKVTADTAIITDLELEARWQDDEQKVEYVTVTCKDGDTVLGSFEIEKGSSVENAPVSPTKTGYTFKGWKASATATECAAFPLENVTEDLTLYADWTVDSYTVKFDLAGGKLDGSTTIADKKVNHGDKVSDPGTPTKDGYDFVGWYNGVDAYSFDEKVTSDLSLVAVWSAKEPTVFTVKFDLNGAAGDAPADQQVVEGGHASTPDNPTWEGHAFKGWYTDAACTGDKFNFATSPIKKNTTLYAKWAETYTVTFDFNNGSGNTENREVEVGKAIGDLPHATYEGFTFSGWFYEDAKGDLEEADKTFKPTSDITLKAYWDHGPVYVKFWDGNYVLSSDKVTYGKALSKPEDPTKTGYTFVDWYSDSELTNKYLFNGAAITEDTNIYSKWTINTYNVTFDTGKGSAVEAQKVEYGSCATRPESDPTREGYTFTGWYADKECAREFKFESKKIDEDTTVYAGWKVKKFTVTFDTAGGSAVDSQSVEYGSCATRPESDPTREGYTFEDWMLDGKSFDFKTPVTSDLKLIASWKETKTDPDDGGKEDDGKDDGDKDDGGKDDGGKDDGDKGDKDDTTPNPGDGDDGTSDNTPGTDGGDDGTSDNTPGTDGGNDGTSNNTPGDGNNGGTSTSVTTETKTVATGATELAGTGDVSFVVASVAALIGIAAMAFGALAKRRG